MFIYLIAVGSVEKRLLLACAKNVKEVFGFEVRISDVPSITRVPTIHTEDSSPPANF